MRFISIGDLVLDYYFKNNNLLGIVTRTDLINIITNLEQFPIVTN